VRQDREPLVDSGPGSVTRMWSVGQGQVVDLIFGCENGFSEVGIIEGSDTEPGHKEKAQPWRLGPGPFGCRYW
jgi:hypothetical protein